MYNFIKKTLIPCDTLAITPQYICQVIKKQFKMKQNFRTMKSKFLIAGIASIALLASCSDDDSDDNITPATNSNNSSANLTMNISGLEDLGPDYAYEGWIMVNGSPVSTGTFTVDASGNPSATGFTVDQAQLDVATKYILTIEPNPDNDPAPSDQKLIAGDFSGNTAAISTAVAPAIGDFSSAAGTYFLRTPTDETGMNNGNDENGIWFGAPGMPPSANFTLPTLPTGWAYEGWVVTSAGPISTGTFTDFGDRDGSNMFSGTQANAGPPIPGEDFFNNAPSGQTFPLDVRGKTVVISVEPVPDNSPMPFLLKPLLSNIDMNAAFAPTSHNFGQNLSSLPTGTVTR